MKNQISLKLLSRIAGLLYLLVILGGIFTEVFVRQKLMVSGDPIATANNILENESLYRWGFVIGLLYLMCNIPIMLIFFEIFKKVNKRLATLFLFFFLSANILEIMNMINHFMPLELLEIGANFNDFGNEKSAALSYVSLSIHSIGYSISLVFFGCHCLLFGYLIFNSNFLPRLIGILIMLAGLCYLTDSFSVFLAPKFASSLFPYILLPCLIGESTLAFWLLFKGIKITSERE